MKRSNKITALMLCAIFLLSSLLMACAGSPDTADATTEAPANDGVTGEGEETTEPLNAREAIPDGLPEKDYGGYEFRIYTYPDPKGFSNSMFVLAEEQIGEVINDAIYLANRAVEERFNIKIKNVDSGADDVGHVSSIKKLIKAGDDAFDISFGHDIQLGSASLEGNFVNLYKVPYLDFSKPWWPENTVKSLTLLDQMYTFSNAVSYLGIHWTRVLFINKDKAKDYGLEIPYQQVFDGTWTLDKLIAMTKDVYTDVNGNGEKDADDFFGYAFTGPFYCSLEPFGIDAVTPDDAEILKLSINTPRTISAVEKMYELVFGSGSFYDKDTESKATKLRDRMFKDGKCLFTYTELGMAIEEYRNSDVNYGILPMPKLDENQPNYIAGTTDKLGIIPTTNEDLERTGIILEAMSAEAYKKVFPAYYEVAMKNKFLQDEESVRILDLITETRVLSFSYIFMNTFNQTLTELFYNAKTPNTDFTSFYEKRESIEVKSIAKLIDKFQGMA